MRTDRGAQPALQYPLPPAGIPAEWRDLLERIDRLEVSRAQPPARRP